MAISRRSGCALSILNWAVLVLTKKIPNTISDADDVLNAVYCKRCNQGVSISEITKETSG